MPYIVIGLSHHHYTFIAWRLAFYVPASMHIIVALLIIFLGQAGLLGLLRINSFTCMRIDSYLPGTPKLMHSCWTDHQHLAYLCFLAQPFIVTVRVNVY